MSDEERIEAMLGRCRPTGLPAGLHERIFGVQAEGRLMRRRLWWAAAAAGLVLAAGVGWLLLSGQQQGVVDSGVEVVREAGGDEQDLEAQWARIERAIFEAKEQAQLLAAAEILAKAPGGQDEAGRTYEYLMRSYPETEAAREAAERRQDLLHRRIGHEES